MLQLQGGGKDPISYQDTGSAQEPTFAEAMAPGMYNVDFPPDRPGPLYTPFQWNADTIVPIEEGAQEVIWRHITQFLSEEGKEVYSLLGSMWKMGILMYGPPGCGKTLLAKAIIDRAIKEHGAIALTGLRPHMIKHAVDRIRTNDTDRLVIVLLEELDSWIKRGYEEEILDLLDGYDSTKGTVVLCTTNHIDKIPERLRARPSRFQVVTELGMPNENQRRLMIKAKVPEQLWEMLDVELEDLVAETDGMSYDQIKGDLLARILYGSKLAAVEEVPVGGGTAVGED